MGLVVGVDASRNRSGGAVAHLVGLFTEVDPRDYGIEHVHLWAYRSLADKVPDRPWLTKHVPTALSGSVPKQMWWQYRHLPGEALAAGCQAMFNTDAGSVCPFEPAATISQDMLSFEPGEMKRYGLSKARLRLLMLRYIQAWSLKRAKRPIFLTHYAAKMIQQVSGPLPRKSIIPHGVSDRFRQQAQKAGRVGSGADVVRLLYVSNTAMYKHQWHVVRAVAQLHAMGFKVRLTLVGGGNGKAQDMLEAEIARSDPSRQFLEQLPFIAHDKVPEFLTAADIFVFASSCENMPVTLLEGMAARLPIACSNRGPMPEILQDGGVFFDPENPESIADALKSLISNAELRESLAARAQALASQFTWHRCADETWKLMAQIARGDAG